MSEEVKKTSVSSVVCFDIIDFAKKSETEKQALLKQFNTLINRAVVDIPQKDRVIVETGHGAIITCSGALESALEDALFIAITVRDELLDGSTESDNPLYLLIGINLGSVKVAKSVNVNEAPNVIGGGVTEAQRIMSFASPNQILVSRAYYDMASKLTLEIAQMFEKYDMHAYEHDIYAVRRLGEKATADNSAAITGDAEAQEESSTKGTINWRAYVLPILLAVAMLFVFTKWMDGESTDTLEQPTVTVPIVEDAETLVDEPANQAEEGATQDAVTQEKAVQEKADQPTVEKKKTVKKKAKKKAVKKQKQKPSSNSKVEKQPASVESVPAEPTAESKPENEKSGWDTFKDNIKQGDEKPCTQAARAMNQCD